MGQIKKWVVGLIILAILSFALSLIPIKYIPCERGSMVPSLEQVQTEWHPEICSYGEWTGLVKWVGSGVRFSIVGSLIGFVTVVVLSFISIACTRLIIKEEK
ncbi:MAG TPA: hypothetical protein VK158_02595 [Acidobacteriota bacterium]|nr:hypothetical protein [Acidobacteriota bacterium]